MIIGISIVKRVLFRGVQQPFSNTYHYTKFGALDAGAEGLIDELVTIEKDLHSTMVTFLHARCWKAGGSKAENEMIFQKPLSGTGTKAQNSNLDQERAILARWRVGKDIRGLPVYLRKWYHPCGNPANVMFSAGALQNTAQIPSGDLALIQAQVEKVREIGALEDWNLCSPNGNRVAEEPCVMHPWLEHHQLGDQWRS